MIKYQKYFLRTVGPILVLLVIFAIYLIIDMMFSLYSLIVLIIYVFINRLYERSHPYTEVLEEINRILEMLDTENVKQFIQHSFFKRGFGLRKICHDLEKKFHIEVYIPKGHDYALYKSDKIEEKLFQLLGCKDSRDYYEKCKKFGGKKDYRII